MKTFAICGVASGLAFLLMGHQMGLFNDGNASDGNLSTEEKKETGPKARFPQDLAPAARAKPVPQAAPFNGDAKVYPMVFLKTNGTLYEKWQERLNDGWAAEKVEHTQLAVILGAPKKQFVNVMRYPNGAPPIERYKYELEVSVVEAHTGKVVANRLFVNVPRAIKPVESWELTQIGEPVAFKTVFNWVVSNARANFPVATTPEPLITVVE